MSLFLSRRAVALATSFLALSATVPVLAAEPLRVGQTFLPAGLDPTKGSNGWALVSDGVGENLFTIDAEGALVPELAEGAESIDAHDWTITLKPDRFFSDGTPVDAAAITAAFAHTIEASPAARATGGTLTFKVIDDRHFTVATEKPVGAIESMFAEWPLIAYRLNGDGTATFSGPYRVASFTPDQSLALEPNPHYPGASQRAPVSLRKFSDADSLALAFEGGQLDLAFGLPSQQLPRLKANANLTIKSFPVAYQYMAWFNTRRGALADPHVRQALDLGFDRKQLALAINGGTPATGPYAAYFPFAGKTARPYDLAAAKKLLDGAGWTAGPDGFRSKNGTALALTVLAYPQRPDLVTLLPVVKAQLRALGVNAATRVAENIGGVAASGDFDVLMWAQHTAPSGDPAFFLNSMLRTGASLNYSGYTSRDFDALLDQLAGANRKAQRAALATEAEQKIFADAPVSFLLTPDWHVGLSKRLAGYEPWGSDYHILRASMGETR